MFNFRPKIPWLHVPSEPLEDAPPGFRVQPETSHRPWWDAFGPTTDAYDPGIGVPQRRQTNVDGAFGHGHHPEDIFNWYVEPVAPIVPSEIDPHSQGGIWPLPDQMVDPQSSQAEAVTELPSEVPVPGFQVEAPEDAQHYPIPADDWRPDAWPQHIQGGSSDIGSESLVGNWPGGVIPSVGGYTGNLPGYDPVYFPEPPPDRVQQALDEIAGLYGLDRFRPTGLSNPAASSIWTNPAANDAREDYRPVNGFDPRYVLPANTGAGGMRPPPPPTQKPPPSPKNQNPTQTQTRPSNTHNNPPDPIPPTKPIHPRPTPHAQTPRQIVGQPVDLTGSAVVAELLARTPALDKHIERIRPAARVRDDDATINQSVPPGGLTTKVGVQMHPDIPPPAVDELPIHEHLKNGAIGEHQLANRIVMTVPGERVLYYGNAAGQQGADIISVSPDGIVSVWDSKWRSGPRPMSEGGRAHQKEQALDRLCDQVKNEITKAAESGRLPLHVAAKAMENATARNFFINTIGTGSAHRGVSQYIGGCKAGELRRF